MNEITEKTNKKSFLVIVICLIVFLGIIALWFFFQSFLANFVTMPGCKQYLENIGLLGDSFGSLNTLFSGLAFGGIIISIYLQSKELEDTRKELRGQKVSLEKQNFESTLFQLIKLHNDIVNQIDLTNISNKPSLEEKLLGNVTWLF